MYEMSNTKVVVYNVHLQNVNNVDFSMSIKCKTSKLQNVVLG